MKIYNTLTRKKDEFKPIDEKEVRMYLDGIYNTVLVNDIADRKDITDISNW